MKRVFRFSAPLMVVAVVLSMTASTQGKGVRGLATITGTVRDNKGLPLAGAVIQLIREGANQLVKQTRTGADGNFSAKIPSAPVRGSEEHTSELQSHSDLVCRLL